MSINQYHGKTFENIIRLHLYPECPEQNNTAQFDIPKQYTNSANISIKTTSRNIVDLSDARRFWNNTDDIIFIVGLYKQEQNTKIFNEIIEATYNKQALQKIKSPLSIDEINEFHHNICQFGFAEHGKARQFAKTHKKFLFENKNSIILLNPKIDSKSQRRLQCSIKMVDFIQYATNIEYYSINKKIPLPIVIDSTARYQ